MYCPCRWKSREDSREWRPRRAVKTRLVDRVRSVRLTATSFIFISIFPLRRSLKMGISNMSQSKRRAMKLMVIAASSRHSGDRRTFCRLVSFGVVLFVFLATVRCVPLASISSVSGSRLYRTATNVFNPDASIDLLSPDIVIRRRCSSFRLRLHRFRSQ